MPNCYIQYSLNKGYCQPFNFPKLGAAEEIRTPDPWFRRPMLYPAELQPRIYGSP